ncbi:PTS transporter subunit EIIC [Spiroplasma clarkii]|nr:PTS transporter subunit EIIC [Spiroplasma clarkii]
MFVAVFNLVTFLITAATFRAEQARFNFFYDSKGMLAAIIQTFLVIEFYRILANNKKMLIKMPKQVPPMVATGFSLLIPVALTLILVSSINTAAWAIGEYGNYDITSSSGAVVLARGEYGFVGLFYKTLSAPFTALISGNEVGLGFGLSYQFLIGFFWFFGLNGSSVVNGAYYPFLLQMFMQNADAVSQYSYAVADAQNMLSVINIQFIESYSQTTGWGHTGALLIAIGIFGKAREQREVAKIAAVPACFSINEPVTFGIPIMLHPVYGVGAMFAMPITLFIAWLVVGPIGIVRKSYIMVPWTLPPGIGALLSTGFDWRAMILSWFCLAVIFVWYIPFVLIANKYQANLNIKSYMDTGMSRDAALAQIAQDEVDYQEQKRLAKEAKIAAKKAKLAEKQEFLKLPKAEQEQILHNKKMLKMEAKALEKLASIKTSKATSKTILVETIPYGGYKIRIDGKTVASALSDEKMREIVGKICQANQQTSYTLKNINGETTIVELDS